MIILVGLVVAGAFVLWPRSQIGRATVSGDSETYRVDLTTSPRPGPVTTSVQVVRHDNGPVLIDRIAIESVMPAMGHAMPQVIATKQNDRFEAGGELFTMSGLWDVSLHVADETVTVRIPVLEGQE